MHSLWFVQWDFTRRDHLGNPGRVFGSGLVSKKPSYMYFSLETHHLRKATVSSKWWDSSKKPRKKIARKAMMTSSEENQPLPTANVALPGIICKASVFSATSKNRTWIIDTGASDHMTWDSSQLKSVLPPSQSVISTANDSTSPITGEGSVILSNTLTLDIVLVVPSLKYNLLSVS